MRLKIFYRSPVVWNVILFILFSFFFLYLQEIFYNLSSILKKELIFEFVKDNKLILGVFGIAMFSVYRMSAYAKQLTFVVIGITAIQTMLNLNVEFSKMILVLLFFYLLLFFYVYQFFSMDLEESYYRPKYDKSDLFTPMLTRIEVSLISGEHQALCKGLLTNWSSEGCFICLESSNVLSEIKSIKLSLDDHDFYQDVVIASKFSDSTGYGLKFVSGKTGRDSKLLGWSEFYEIIEQMGYSPELLA